MNKFVQKFRRFCEQIDNPPIMSKYQVFGIRYNIHKRSLPVHTDIPIMWGVTEKEAQIILAKILHTKTEDKEDGKYITYYDMVREDGIRSSVYDNPEKFVIQDSTVDEFKQWIKN